MQTTDLLFGIYTQRELLLAGRCVLAVTAWCFESLKAEEKEGELTKELRDEHSYYLTAMSDLRRAHDEKVRRLTMVHEADIEKERSESWKEGVRMGAEATKRKRDKAGGFA